MKRILASIAVLSLVSACATPYRPTPFDHATSGVTSIQVVEDAMPPSAQVRKLATNGANIAASTSGYGLAGLVVGLAAAGIEANIQAGQNQRINAVLTAQKLDGEAVFDDAFNADLQAQNYEISSIKIDRDKVRNLVVVAPQADAKAGSAVLDVDGGAYGYQQVGGTKRWRPYVVISVRMYDAKDPKKVLLDNYVEYNAVAPLPNTVSIPADDQYGFSSVEDIEAHPEQAAEGLRVALQASAHATAQLLK